MTHLVIGYGNSLRNDDGAGQVVAEMVASWELPDVRSLSLTQLTPELAADIATAETVIFVDAVVVESDAPARVEIQVLEPQVAQIHWGHHGDPRSLLALTHHLYQATPTAYWVLVAGTNFDLGEEFSATIKAGIQIAVERIKQILNEGVERLE